MMGSGPCLVSCGPVLISYIAGTKYSALHGLKSWFIFAFSRFIAAVFLGFVAGALGAELFNRLNYTITGYIIWFTAGIFISFLGLLVVFGKHANLKVCNILNNSFIENDTKSLIALGLIIGLLPCAPFVGIISYITAASTNYIQGMLMGAAFGFGTALSPLMLFAMIAGALPGLKLLQKRNEISCFQPRQFSFITESQSIMNLSWKSTQNAADATPTTR